MSVPVVHQCRGDRFLKPWNSGADDLLSAQVHERNAGVSLHIRSDATNRARTGNDISFVVAPEIETEFFQLGVVHLFDPSAAPACPFLIDEKLVVVLDEELGGVACLRFAVSEQPA